MATETDVAAEASATGVAQYQPQLTKLPLGDFMRPQAQARKNSSANGIGIQAEDAGFCVVMVGLPARGKSLIAQKGMLGHVR